jgi:hypothetical protein
MKGVKHIYNYQVSLPKPKKKTPFQPMNKLIALLALSAGSVTKSYGKVTLVIVIELNNHAVSIKGIVTKTDRTKSHSTYQ